MPLATRKKGQAEERKSLFGIYVSRREVGDPFLQEKEGTDFGWQMAGT